MAIPTDRVYGPLPWLSLRLEVMPGGQTAAKVPTPERSCGTCTACCTIMPVEEINKVALKRCEYLEFGPKPCSIYAIRPDSCRVWSCLWLLDKTIPDALRPDRSHIVIDMMFDQIEMNDADTGKSVKALVVQMWADPAHPDAHRDPLLRSELAVIGDKARMPMLVRTGSKDAFLLAPPALTGTGEWLHAYPVVTHDYRLLCWPFPSERPGHRFDTRGS